jgi:hypothetical protein
LGGKRARRSTFEKNIFSMKNTRRALVLLFAVFAAHTTFSQKSAKPEKAGKDEKAIKTVINQFFEGMAKGDTVLLKSTCTAAPVFQTFMADKDGDLKVQTGDFAEFVAFIGTPTKDKYDERIEFEAVHAEKSLASVWTPYKFYLNDKLSHCGTNSFQLVKTTEGWKIQYIIDTRRRQGCE